MSKKKNTIRARIDKRALLSKPLGRVPKEFKEKYLKLHPRRKLTAQKFREYVVNRRVREAKKNFTEKHPRRKPGTQFFKKFVERSVASQSHKRKAGRPKIKKPPAPPPVVASSVPSGEAPLVNAGADWISVVDAIGSKDDPNMTVSFNFEGIKFEGKREDFPAAELREKLEKKITESIEFKMEKSYWRLLPIFKLSRYFDQKQDQFTRLEVEPMDDWEEIAGTELDEMEED